MEPATHNVQGVISVILPFVANVSKEKGSDRTVQQREEQERVEGHEKRIESKVSLPSFSLPPVPLAFAPSLAPSVLARGSPTGSSCFGICLLKAGIRDLKYIWECMIPKITIRIEGLINPIGDALPAGLSRVW